MSDDRNHGPFRIHKIEGGISLTLSARDRRDSTSRLVAVMADNVGVSFACFFGSGDEGKEALGTAEWFADLANENARLRQTVADLAARKQAADVAAEEQVRSEAEPPQ